MSQNGRTLQKNKKLDLRTIQSKEVFPVVENYSWRQVVIPVPENGSVEIEVLIFHKFTRKP